METFTTIIDIVGMIALIGHLLVFIFTGNTKSGLWTIILYLIFAL